MIADYVKQRHAAEPQSPLDTLSEREKQRHREEMDALRLDPPLSQIIIDSRR